VVSSSEDTTSTATRAQVRLDQQLQASGFSEMDASRDLELYYFNNNNNNSITEAQQQGKASDDDDDDEGDDDDDEEEEVNEQDDADSNVDSTLSNDEYQAEYSTTDNIVDTSLLQSQRRAIAEEKARARVRRQLDDAKKKRGKQGAFRSRNSNKTYVKGKRVMNDIGY
jgi:hypothetical protein